MEETERRIVLKIEDFKALFDTLTLYKGVLDDFLIQNFRTILNLLDEEDGFKAVVPAWSDMVNELYNQEYQGDWAKYINNLILFDDNYFSLECARGAYDKLNENIKSAAASDIQVLSCLAELDCASFKDLLYYKFPYDKDMIDSLASFDTICPKITFDEIVKSYKSNGISIFAAFKAFKFNSNQEIEPIYNCDEVRLADLKRYEREQKIVTDNTLGFLKGKPFNNVLLYGDRGTGKSSTVKAILNEYYKEGLRVIQVYKENLVHLDALMRDIADIPLKFIIFIDDLTFCENDDNFGALKAVLEGSLAKQPSNMVIYATSNRRHLVRETFAAREGDEVHLADTIDETVSLSDRFGITVTFTLPNKDKFLKIVKEIKEDRNLAIADDELFSGAEKFAVSKGNRSPRLAKQYVDYLQARLELNLGL